MARSPRGDLFATFGACRSATATILAMELLAAAVAAAAAAVAADYSFVARSCFS